MTAFDAWVGGCIVWLLVYILLWQSGNEPKRSCPLCRRPKSPYSKYCPVCGLEFK